MRDLEKFYTELFLFTSNYILIWKLQWENQGNILYHNRWIYAQSQTWLYAVSDVIIISNQNKKIFVCSWSKCTQFVFGIFVTKWFFYYLHTLCLMWSINTLTFHDNAILTLGLRTTHKIPSDLPQNYKTIHYTNSVNIGSIYHNNLL